MPERGCHDRLIAGAHHAAELGVHHSGLRHVALDPIKRLAHGSIVGTHDPVVPADQRGQRHGFGRRESQVPAGAVVDTALPVLAAQVYARAVGNFSREDVNEEIGIDRTAQAQRCRALAEPGAGHPVRCVVLRVVSIPLIIGDALRGRGDCADGDHHQ